MPVIFFKTKDAFFFLFFCFCFVFHQGSLSRTFTVHRSPGKVGDYFFDSFLTLPPTSDNQTSRAITVESSAPHIFKNSFPLHQYLMGIYQISISAIPKLYQIFKLKMTYLKRYFQLLYFKKNHITHLSLGLSHICKHKFKLLSRHN